MTDTIDRMWNIRDAVLLWLYHESAAGNSSPQINIDKVNDIVKWQDDPITEDEFARATTKLKAAGLITGPEAWGGGVVRPSITIDGERAIESGRSSRPGAPPANPSGTTINNTFNNHGPSNIAVNSSDFTQNITVGEQSDRILAVADALEKYVAEAPANAAQAQDIIAGLRVEGSDPVGNKNKLMAYLSNAIATVSLAAGTEIGQQVTDLAVSAIQSLG